MQPPKIDIGLVSNMFVRQMVFVCAGDKEYGHSHPFDHLTLLAKGSIDLTVEGTTTHFQAPQMIFIAKNKEHELVAAESGTVAYCIHGLRDVDVSDDIISEDMLPRGHDAMREFIYKNTKVAG
jgi:hypothetical protein